MTGDAGGAGGVVESGESGPLTGCASAGVATAKLPTKNTAALKIRSPSRAEDPAMPMIYLTVA
jgi:hypothetical protein